MLLYYQESCNCCIHAALIFFVKSHKHKASTANSLPYIYTAIVYIIKNYLKTFVIPKTWFYTTP